ncbi:urease accessory protein [Exophiala aquamarina CBS 119918]|uniref:Urease accessory protein n=1 Tax=Exophiala aquamarina CBS 119918 TaxID=1182545 RepID=A0A072PEN5_9EURO|nr:urease accessory protein [Exophiala aquamarina CBS 119918]KEF58222.1 urease accessory protein [Exophiala aquamarina CBS 119918]
MNFDDAGAIRARVVELEAELQATTAILRRIEQRPTASSAEDGRGDSKPFSIPVTLPLGPSIHNLMLLSDSALPLGSFAYSSGLESFLAHHKPLPAGHTTLSLFQKFLSLSIQSVAYTNIPYALATFRDPLDLMDLDNDLDASTPCNVAKRASIAQGRALLSVWEKAFASSTKSTFEEGVEPIAALEIFSKDLKIAAVSNNPLPVNGHFAPVWGVVCLALGLNLEEAGYLFLLNHAKAVVSAAVRASVMGPYVAQTVLAGKELQDLIRGSLERVWLLRPEDAGQVVPSMDLWLGRHELLYSRIFNS